MYVSGRECICLYIYRKDIIKCALDIFYHWQYLIHRSEYIWVIYFRLLFVVLCLCAKNIDTFKKYWYFLGEFYYALIDW